MIDWAKIHGEKRFKFSYIPLSLMSFIYGIGIRLWLKKNKGKKKMSLPGFTVSIGNLTAGGTGKTPATCMMAEWAVREGYAVAILSRGHGGKNKKKVCIASDGKRILAGPKEIGDEPYLLAGRLPGVPVIIAKDRFLAGQEASRRFGSSFFILDDGFQRLELKRDLDLLLMDAVQPFGNGRLLPRGPLREPANEAARADAIIFTRAGLLKNESGTDNKLKNLFHGKALFMGDHIPEKVVFPLSGTTHAPAFLKGKRIAAFAGIARPDSFRDTLINLGAEILFFKVFPDHHPFTADEIKGLVAEKDNAGADFLITTEKDWTKAGEFLAEDPFTAYMTIRFDILNEREKFFQMVREKISLGNNIK